QLNLSKCELFSRLASNFSAEHHHPVRGRLHFPDELRTRSTSPHFLLLGSPIGDPGFCSLHVESLRAANSKLLERLKQLEDPQVALHLLRTCAGFAKFVYVARTTPPHLVSSSLLKCDEDIRASLESFAALQLTNTAWDQAQLSLSSGGLGLRSLSTHCVAAYINSHLCALPNLLTASLRGAFALYSAQLGKPVDDLAIASMVDNPPSQRTLSSKLERLVYSRLYSDALVGDKLRLISVAARRSAAWLQAMPSRGPLDLTLLPDEMQVLLQHRLGLPLSRAGETCPIRCGELLDVLGHHQLTCKHGGFVVSRHNRVRDALFSLAAVAGMGPQKEQGAFMRDR